MNPTDILKEILGGGSSKTSGGGGNIFKDILGGGAPSSGRQSVPPPPSESDVARQARELEDIFNVGGSRSPAPSPPDSRSSDPWDQPAGSRSSTGLPTPLPPLQGERASADREDAEAKVMLRAMIQAAKADGRLSREEHDAILKQIGGESRRAIEFLRHEFKTQVDVRDFAWSIPMGMEYKVYAVSLASIDLDTKSESDYLKQLAHGLRLPREVCAHVHQRYGAPAPG